MRKFIDHPALEAERIQTAADQEEAARRTALENISLEEEQLLIDEANTAAVQSGQELDETVRISEVSDALEDLAVIAGDITEPTQNELNLIQNSAQMAVAGTDVAPEEVVPAIESLDDWKNKAADFGRTVKAKAKEIWEKIMAFLKRIWAQIKEFFYRIVDTIPALQKRLAELAKDLQKAKTEHQGVKAKSMKCSVGAISLSYNGQPAKSSQDLLMGLTSLNETTRWVFGTYADRLCARGNSMAKVIENFDWANPSAASEALLTILSGTHPLPKLPGQQGGAAIGGTTVSTGPQLLGGIHLERVEGNAQGVATYQALGNFQKERVTVIRTKQGDLGREYDMEVIDPERGLTLVKDAEEILKSLEGWKKKTRSAMEEINKTLEKASNKAASEGEKAEKAAYAAAVRRVETADKSEGHITEATVAQYRQALNFNTAFTRWTRDPAVDLMASALSSVRGLIYVLRRSMDFYEFQNPMVQQAQTLRIDDKPAKQNVAPAASKTGTA